MILEMADVVADAYDLPQAPLIAATNPVSPLFNTPDQFEAWLPYVRRGVPLLISPEVQAGATGPATLAGALVQATAEFLGHATIAQLITPGVPVMYGCVSSAFDMRKMLLPYGAPEADLMLVATAQMGRYYGIPTRGTGSTSDAMVLDMQAGVETLMSTLLCLMTGVSYVCHGAGELENSLATSYEKIVIDHEVIGMARRLMQGINVTPETLAFEVIHSVGPKGHFLEAEHTMKHFRTEQFMPDLMTRDKYDVWEEAGGKGVEERARERVGSLLESHQPNPLPAKAEQEIEDISAAALREAGSH
jgi:trimethylamine--corrinoid protein Co-methyltransferase